MTEIWSSSNKKECCLIIFLTLSKAEKVKKRLVNISVSVEVDGGTIKVIVLANKIIQSIELAESFLKENGKEGKEDLLGVAINKVLD
jgi:DNA-binding protein YbaB